MRIRGASPHHLSRVFRSMAKNDDDDDDDDDLRGEADVLLARMKTVLKLKESAYDGLAGRCDEIFISSVSLFDLPYIQIMSAHAQESDGSRHGRSLPVQAEQVPRRCPPGGTGDTRRRTASDASSETLPDQHRRRLDPAGE